MIRPIPAEGYTRITGKRKPPASMGTHLWCQIRNGWCDMFAPWPIATTRWVWDGSDGDVVAVKRTGDAPEVKEGRQANGSYA